MLSFRIINTITNCELPRNKFLIDGDGKLFMQYRIDGNLILEEINKDDYEIKMETEEDAL